MSEESRNNFKRLEKEVDLRPRDDKEINGTISFISSVSRVIELYLPGFFQLMISMTGGGGSKTTNEGRPNIKKTRRRDGDHSPSQPPK